MINAMEVKFLCGNTIISNAQWKMKNWLLITLVYVVKLSRMSYFCMSEEPYFAGYIYGGIYMAMCYLLVKSV